MKKLSVVITLLSVMLLSGCSREKQQTPEKWALDYVLEEYNSDYSGYGVFGYFIVDGKITTDEMEQIENNQHAKMYLIMIVDNSGRGRMYNVLIVYELKPFDMYFGYKYIKESKIIDVDIEVALYD